MSNNKKIYVCDNNEFGINEDNTTPINPNLITFDLTTVTWDSTEITFDNDN